MTFTFKTHFFGGINQEELGATNPFIAPITKISSEVHMVPYLEPDNGDIERNNTGIAGDVQDLGNIKEATIPNYFNKLENGEIPYPEYEQLDWIMDYQWNPETGGYELPYDPNQPYEYTPEDGDGLTFVSRRHRLYDELVEITH